MTNFVSLTWKEFEEQFKPIKNHFSKDPDETMFETYGEEVDFVIANTPERKVWTWADGDYCSFVSNDCRERKRPDSSGLFRTPSC